jgi:integrase/recombinase XerD
MPGWLAVPNHHTAPGRRDYALLLFLRNTGARTSEATQGTVAELALQTSPASGCWPLETKPGVAPLGGGGRPAVLRSHSS